MTCAWREFIHLLPTWMRAQVDEFGKDNLQELRLRSGLAPELILGDKVIKLNRGVQADDLHFVINAASQYSPWSAETARQGYITARGGHRIGICGEAVMHRGEMTGIRTPTSLCLRVARDFPGIARHALHSTGSILIIGRPGSGKTTLLRDLIRQISDSGTESIAVVDERGELFPHTQETSCFDTGSRTDILSGCTKRHGITALLRTMGPACIAVDEITQDEDCQALLRAGWSGVRLLATAHASCRNDLLCRSVYGPIVASRLFDTLLVMQPDKSWKAERM